MTWARTSRPDREQRIAERAQRNAVQAQTCLPRRAAVMGGETAGPAPKTAPYRSPALLEMAHFLDGFGAQGIAEAKRGQNGAIAAEDGVGSAVVAAAQQQAGQLPQLARLAGGHVGAVLADQAPLHRGFGAADSITVDSTLTIPALKVRRAETTVELASGQTFAVGGLFKRTTTRNIDSFPGLASIPVLGALFRSTRYNRSETELVILITPYLVDPLKSSDVRLPTDDFRPASDMEMFFYGALSSISHGERTTSQTPSLEGPVGFMVE